MDRVTGGDLFHSFHQPNRQTYSEKLGEALKTDSSNEDTMRCSNVQESLILNLNDDCLEHICKQLDLADQINFGLTCQRFFNVMARFSRIEHAYVQAGMFSHWNTSKINNFLQVVGAQIKHFEMNYVSEKSIVDTFSSICRNIEKLKVRSGTLNPDFMISLITNMQSLKELEITCTSLDDSFIEYLKKFENLKRLQIICNRYVTGKYICLLRGLEYLSIRQCYKVTSENFRDSYVNLPNLRYLDILYSDVLKMGDCELISKNLLELETLKVSVFDDEISHLGYLPKLKKLEIQTKLDKAEYLKTLTEFRGNELEELKLHSTEMNAEVVTAVTGFKNLKVLLFDSHKFKDEFLIILSKLTELQDLSLDLCFAITDEAVLKIFEKCLKLKRLNLERCDRLTPNLLKRAVKLLEEQRAQLLRKEPVLLTGTYSINYDDLAKEVHLFDKYSNLLRISLKEEYVGSYKRPKTNFLF